jgi:hypothetical protein
MSPKPIARAIYDLRPRLRLRIARGSEQGSWPSPQAVEMPDRTAWARPERGRRRAGGGLTF